MRQARPRLVNFAIVIVDFVNVDEFIEYNRRSLKWIFYISVRVHEVKMTFFEICGMVKISTSVYLKIIVHFRCNFRWCLQLYTHLIWLIYKKPEIVKSFKLFITTSKIAASHPWTANLSIFSEKARLINYTRLIWSYYSFKLDLNRSHKVTNNLGPSWPM